jgi:hypothetical protein
VNLHDQQTLMQLYDGELPPDEIESARLRLEQDPEWRSVFEGLGQLSEAVCALCDARSEGADDLVDRVLREIDRDQARKPQGARLIRLPLRRALLGVAAAAALAAGVALLIGRTPGAVPSPEDVLSAPVAALLQPLASDRAEESPVVAVVEDADADLAPSVAIEAVDFGASNGTIFMVPTGSTATPVVWVMDEPAAQGRMEQL